MPTKNRTISAFVMFPNDLVEEIKAYQEENKIQSNNEAIRTLIKKGLKDSQE